MCVCVILIIADVYELMWIEHTQIRYGADDGHAVQVDRGGEDVRHANDTIPPFQPAPPLRSGPGLPHLTSDTRPRLLIISLSHRTPPLTPFPIPQPHRPSTIPIPDPSPSPIPKSQRPITQPQSSSPIPLSP